MERSIKIIIFFLLTCTSFIEMAGQQNKVYSKMTLDELLDIDVIVTASKMPEDFFETPLSTTIISKEEIEKSGVTSIPEALRLSQGVIVRETSPGNYDIHIRGYDDITKNVYFTLPYNTTTLVMIDNRIVYSYFSGGTLWETLPIDLIDVERIEIVRGPTSALYGANAVTGVINIITSHANKDGMNVLVNGTTGTNDFKKVNATVGYNWDDKTKLSFSGNFSEIHRFDNDYFDFNKKNYSSIDDLLLFVKLVKNLATNEFWTFNDYQEELGIQYDVDVSLKRMGGNIFLHHNFSELTQIDVSMGAQKSQTQRIGFINMVTPLSQIESESYYFDTKVKHKSFSGQFNINSGEDLSNYKFSSYKFTNIDVNLEYFKQLGKLSVRPGIGYKYLCYNSPLTYEEPFDLNKFNTQFKDEDRISSSYSAYLLSEWRPTQKLRFIGAIRVDKFDMNKNYFTNLEIASTYRINKNNLIRFAFSKANKSPFFFDSYINTKLKTTYDYPIEGTNVNVQIPANIDIHGQEDLKYPTITNEEIGWRTKINSNLSLDVELFYSEVNNFVNANIYNQHTVVQHINNLGEVDALVSLNVDGEGIFENYDLTAYQFGAGFTLSYKFSDKVNAKLFGTYQKTNISGRSNIEFLTTSTEVGDLTPDNTISTTVNTTINPTEWSEDLTPSFYGGFYLNYRHNKKWNFGTDAYFYGNQEFTFYNYYDMVDETDIDDSKVGMDINSNLILNAKATYQLSKKTSTYVSFKNILGDHREYGFADKIGRQILIGLKWELK